MVSELIADGVAVKLACETFEISRGGYYAWRSRPESERASANAALVPLIAAIHAKSKETYGHLGSRPNFEQKVSRVVRIELPKSCAKTRSHPTLSESSK